MGGGHPPATPTDKVEFWNVSEVIRKYSLGINVPLGIISFIVLFHSVLYLEGAHQAVIAIVWNKRNFVVSDQNVQSE